MKTPIKKRPKKTKAEGSQADLSACMDYLHGDVADGEFEAACCYEYSRESAVLKEAAKLLASGMDDQEIAVKVEGQFRCGYWFIQIPWGAISECPSFPAKGWNQLSPNERATILRMGLFPSLEIQPLRMNEVWNLQSNGIFEEFNAMAERQWQDKRNSGAKPAKAVYPFIEGWPKMKQRSSQWVHALFNLDFTKTKKRLLQEFDMWLQLPENAARFAAHKRDTTGKTGLFRDRLKDLAAWRLYRELGTVKALKFAADNRLSDKAGRPRRFHDQRKDPTNKLPLHEMPLYSEESAFQKAKAKAETCLGELFPWEFGEYAEERERQEKEREQRWAKMFAEIAPQISKSSS